MFVRQAQPEDYAAVAAFDEWRQATPTLIAAGRCHIAGVDATPQAYALLSFNFFHRAFVDYLFVARAHRRLGLGDALLAHVESLCGRDQLWISTELPNLPMQTVLNKRGYQLSGVIENLQKDPELIYYKRIKHG